MNRLLSRYCGCYGSICFSAAAWHHLLSLCIPNYNINIIYTLHVQKNSQSKNWEITSKFIWNLAQMILVTPILKCSCCQFVFQVINVFWATWLDEVVVYCCYFLGPATMLHCSLFREFEIQECTCRVTWQGMHCILGQPCITHVQCVSLVKNPKGQSDFNCWQVF